MAVFNNSLGMLIAAALFLLTLRQRRKEHPVAIWLVLAGCVILFLYSLGGVLEN